MTERKQRIDVLAILVTVSDKDPPSCRGTELRVVDLVILRSRSCSCSNMFFPVMLAT